jgi:hypothetical protein
VTSYRLVFQGLDTARIRPDDAEATAPLAWFRITWAEDANRVSTVHVYGHRDQVRERPWLSTHQSIAAAVAFCDTLPRVGGDGDYDWSGGTVETTPAP